MITAVLGTICTFGVVTYYNFKDFQDDWRFNIQEVLYVKNGDEGTFGIEGYARFVDGNVILRSKEARPVYELTLNKNLFQCK